ncbi:DUF302 domain-containing protein [Streptomyces sp. NPDC087300]|uniref:DUF302 domain-containing protein n=1 Tax=Streptomyces sp. NPDC087300 TaxID=3365780 RepID=UPI00380E132C
MNEPMPSETASGLVTLPAHGTVDAVVDRLRTAATEAGHHVFAVIDHQANAEKADMTLRPTRLVLFGRPAIGTRLMQDRQTAGIDLPSKVLVWQDEHGETQLTFSTGTWLANRHGLKTSGRETAARLDAAVREFVTRARRPL